MTFIPKQVDTEVNLPKQSQPLEFLYLLAGLVGIFLAVYILLGLAVDLIVPRIPDRVEDRIAGIYKPGIDKSENTPAQKKLQKMVDSLSALKNKKKYKVMIIPSPEVNAFAVPGGRIMVFAGLLKEIKTENELAFVLAHELGHFENRDQLRGIGRMLILFVLSLAFTGSDSGITQLVGEAIKNAQMKFSRDQERKADMFALDLINKKYGNAAGAESLLKKFGPLDDKYPRWLFYFITHPYYMDRVKLIEARIREMGYKVKPQLPVDKVFGKVGMEKGNSGLKGF
jgi:Zn-dependent protease with chaperone function